MTDVVGGEQSGGRKQGSSGGELCYTMVVVVEWFQRRTPRSGQDGKYYSVIRYCSFMKFKLSSRALISRDGGLGVGVPSQAFGLIR